MGDKQYAVRASHCDHRASEEEIYEVLKRTTDPLERSWKKLEKARRIVLKFNMIKPPERIEYFAGRRRELVDDAVARAVLRLLRERTTAELITTDTYPYGNGHVTPDDFNYRYIFATYDVPGGGCMFDHYLLNAIFAEADEVVSIAKMKNHAFMGITLTLKNLYMQDGQVVWNGDDPSKLGSRRKLSGDKKDSALWLKYVDPAEGEGERFERYSECLRLAS